MLINILRFILAGNSSPNCCQKTGMMGLTFDDGPSSATPKILTILKEMKVKATFHFNTGFLDSTSRGYIKKAHADGHDVGLRTNSRRDYNTKGLSETEVKKDLESQFDVLYKITNKKPVYVRSPTKQNQLPKHVDTYFVDKKKVHTTPSYAMHKGDDMKGLNEYLDIINPKFDSGILLLYEEKSANKLKDIIKTIQKKGYSLVPLSTCLSNYDPKSSNVQFNKSKKESGVDSNIDGTWINLLSSFIL
ncbi:YB51 [Hepatospora eriocheir]|uniref:YB51 n=1 Tax=Hepatospora eriocheir TaxID=1081669 RepID=A0A1X0QHU7_9MICR|nr:YB51 [Hepatospora eriocheir]